MFCDHYRFVKTVYRCCSRGICSKLLHFMRPHSAENVSRNGLTKILDAPVHLASMAADLEDNDMEIKSIWVNSRDDSLVRFFYFLVQPLKKKKTYLHRRSVFNFRCGKGRAQVLPPKSNNTTINLLQKLLQL